MNLVVNNVNDGIANIIYMLNDKLMESVLECRDSRNGATIAFTEPVIIEYKYPECCACYIPARDANPFFHIMESLWMLAGRRDVGFLHMFNKNMVNYSDDGIVFNAAYGYRLRKHFNHDQLYNVVKLLTADRNSRQAVALLWDPNDLLKDTKDKACNLELVFKITTDNRLNMTVFNRSNDIIYGTFGANAVHMSMIMMYVCSKLECELGKYYQVSNCLHAYTDGVEGNILNRITDELISPNQYEEYEKSSIDVSYFEGIDDDIADFFAMYDRKDCGLTIARLLSIDYGSKFFNNLVVPMLYLYMKYKINGKAAVTDKDYEEIVPADWRKACEVWINNRRK